MSIVRWVEEQRFPLWPALVLTAAALGWWLLAGQQFVAPFSVPHLSVAEWAGGIRRLLDESEYEAEVVGADPNTDIAILKIEDDHDLPLVRLGDSESIRIGDWAIAIGNPFGRLEGTVTVGVISAKGRSALSIVGGTPALQDFIQTDASINFGNSGGPLVNIKGEAVGMNTAINPLGQGIGFAIPINLVRHVADEIIEHGKVAWGYLGVLPQEITRDLAEALGVEPRSGILVGSVVEDAPAERAGIRRGDIIIKFNGTEVGDVDQFRLKVAETGVDREVPVVVLRDGDRRTFRQHKVRVSGVHRRSDLHGEVQRLDLLGNRPRCRLGIRQIGPCRGDDPQGSN